MPRTATETREVQLSDHREEAARAADRFIALSELHWTADKRRSLIMDLRAADGVNGNPPLDWPRLLAADSFNFVHDVGGIHRHMDRATGALGDFFVPRFAVRTPA